MQNLLPQMFQLTSDELLKIQENIQFVFQEREKQLVLAIQNGDLPKLKTILSLGLQKKSKSLVEQVYKLEFSSLKVEILDEILSEKTTPNDRFSELKSIISTLLESHLTSKHFTQDQFLLAKKHFKPQRIKTIASKIAKNFAKMNKIDEGYEEVHSFINEQGLAKVFLSFLSDSKNKSPYGMDSLFKRYIPHQDLMEKKKKESMDRAISCGDVEVIKKLFKEGVSLPEEKKPYSELFSKLDKDGRIHQAQTFVINNLTDITVGSQVILRTLLHFNDLSNKKETIESVLERYSDEQLELLPKALAKRERHDGVIFVEKWHEAIILQKQLNKAPSSGVKKIKL